MATHEFLLGNTSLRTNCCPLEYLDPALPDGYRARIAHLMQDIETFWKDSTLSDEAGMIEPGCITHTLSDQACPIQ